MPYVPHHYIILCRNTAKMCSSYCFLNVRTCRLCSTSDDLFFSKVKLIITFFYKISKMFIIHTLYRWCNLIFCYKCFYEHHLFHLGRWRRPCQRSFSWLPWTPSPGCWWLQISLSPSQRLALSIWTWRNRIQMCRIFLVNSGRKVGNKMFPFLIICSCGLYWHPSMFIVNTVNNNNTHPRVLIGIRSIFRGNKYVPYSHVT